MRKHTTTTRLRHERNSTTRRQRVTLLQHDRHDRFALTAKGALRLASFPTE
jgi:hypothetical protein